VCVCVCVCGGVCVYYVYMCMYERELDCMYV
jgi:hypothetical protein